MKVATCEWWSDFKYIRIEYDAYRTDLEADLRNPAKAEEAQRQFDIRKEKFEGLREDVAMKIKLLNGNKVGIFGVIIETLTFQMRLNE